MQRFAQSLLELKNKTIICQSCLAITENNPCTICSNQKRNQNQLCIVADTRDMISIESTKQYSGLYFILGGVLNSIDLVKPEQLNTQLLINKIKSRRNLEIILALNPNLEGETTAMYLVKLIKSLSPDIKITRLARGLPMGADLEYADELTLTNALKYRNEM